MAGRDKRWKVLVLGNVRAEGLDLLRDIAELTVLPEPAASVLRALPVAAVVEAQHGDVDDGDVEGVEVGAGGAGDALEARAHDVPGVLGGEHQDRSALVGFEATQAGRPQDLADLAQQLELPSRIAPPGLTESMEKNRHRAVATVSLASSDCTRTWKDYTVPLTPRSNSFPSITNGVGETITIAPQVFLDPLRPKGPRLMAVIPGTVAMLLRTSRASAEGMSSRRLTVVPQIVP